MRAQLPRSIVTTVQFQRSGRTTSCQHRLHTNTVQFQRGGRTTSCSSTTPCNAKGAFCSRVPTANGLVPDSPTKGAFAPTANGLVSDSPTKGAFAHAFPQQTGWYQLASITPLRHTHARTHARTHSRNTTHGAPVHAAGPTPKNRAALDRKHPPARDGPWKPLEALGRPWQAAEPMLSPSTARDSPWKPSAGCKANAIAFDSP